MFSYAVLYLDTLFEGLNAKKLYSTLHSSYVQIKLYQELF